jgi:hypothetical protein
VCGRAKKPLADQQLALVIGDQLRDTQPKPCERAYPKNLDLMPESITLGSWLRRERERRGITLSQISEQTKVSVPLLEGLETDDLSRWPGGIFRRSFARSYATAIGLDGDVVVRRIAEEHPDPNDPGPSPATVPEASPVPQPAQAAAGPRAPVAPLELRQRLMGVALDLLVAAAIAFGFAAAGAELVWPVLAIAVYHALGVLLSGTTPMLAIVAAQQSDREAQPRTVPAQPAADPVRRPEPQQPRRHRGRRSPGRVEVRLDRR